MDALPSSAFLATSHHPSRRPLFHISAVRTSRRPLFRSSAVRTEEKPLRTTIHLPDKPSATTTTTTTTTQPQLEKSRSPRSFTPPPPPPPSPAGGQTPAAQPSIPAALCNAIDFLINNFVDPAVHRPSVDPRNVLSGNRAPVGELPPTPCPVVRGCIPRCLAGGAYIRNGPNPQHLPRRPHHLFEGVGLANTSLAFHAGKLYALGESDLPYAIHLDHSSGEIATLGRCDFKDRLFMGMTAHPKKDPATGELFAFHCGPVPLFVTYFHFDRKGRKSLDVPIFSVRKPPSSTTSG